MDEKQTIIASGLENASLTQFSNSIHDQIEEYVSKHPGTSFMILGTNRKTRNRFSYWRCKGYS